MAGMLARILPSWLRRSTLEGQYRPGPYSLMDGWLAHLPGQYMNWWQLGYSLAPFNGPRAIVEACVSAYSQTVAMCPGDHWRKLDNGGRERITTSALSRIIKRPNDYQSISDFLMNLTRELYEDGEAFGLCIRNARGEVIEIHIMREGCAHVAVDGSIFYSLYGNEVIAQRFDLTYPIPARDVLHVRLHTPHHVLKGVSPILAAALDLGMSGAALNQQTAFYLNMARPSFMLETDEKLDEQQTKDLRQRWNEQTRGEGAGGTPILSWGLKAKPVNVSPEDGQLAELLKMTDSNIALAFRVPLQILGIGGATFSSTELLMQSWIASGLGFALNHIEEAFGLLFGLKGQPEEYLEFNTMALLRSAYRDRIVAMAQGVQGGIFSSDEARADFDLPATPGGFGAMPRVQQQVVPLSYGANMQPPQPPQPTPPPAEPAPPDEAQPDEQRGVEDYLREIDGHIALESQSLH